MTISMNGSEVSEAIEIAMAVGGVLALLIGALIFYLLVRPPRRRRVEPRRDEDSLDVEEMLALIDRMERRLEVLERAVPAEAGRDERLLETSAEGAGTGRKQ